MRELKLTSPISQEKQSSAVTRGQRLMKRRLKMGLSQQALADASGIGASHISRLENGDRIGSFEVWRTLATALGTTWASRPAAG